MSFHSWTFYKTKPLILYNILCIFNNSVGSNKSHRIWRCMAYELFCISLLLYTSKVEVCSVEKLTSALAHARVCVYESVVCVSERARWLRLYVSGCVRACEGVYRYICIPVCVCVCEGNWSPRGSNPWPPYACLCVRVCESTIRFWSSSSDHETIKQIRFYC